MSACIKQTVASHPKFAFTPTFIFCSPICPDNCGVVFFFVKIYFSCREIIFFVRLLKYANFHREYYPSCVTSGISVNLIHSFIIKTWSPVIIEAGKVIFIFWWIFLSDILFLCRIVASKQRQFNNDRYERIYWAFKRQKDGYKVTVKISLCICVVLSWDELKVRQNLLASDYEIYMVCLFAATVY